MCYFRLGRATSSLFAVLAGLLLFLSGCDDVASFYATISKVDLFTQQYNIKAYDFLFVLDNSASMTGKRAALQNNLQEFLSILTKRKAIDYQIAVTTTDLHTDQGKLIASAGGLDVVKSTSSNPVADFIAITDNIADSTTSFWEEGLESAVQAVTLHGGRFMRADAPLVVIFVTDEDDYSCADNCIGKAPETHYNDWTEYDVSRYVNYFKGVKPEGVGGSMIFPIVGTPGDKCTGVIQGKRYLAVRDGVGTGMSGSICPDTLVTTYRNIANFISDRAVRFTLTQKPDQNGVLVSVDDKPVPFSQDDGYVYDAATNSIAFNGDAIPANGSKIVVSYAAAQ